MFCAFRSIKRLSLINIVILMVMQSMVHADVPAGALKSSDPAQAKPAVVASSPHVLASLPGGASAVQETFGDWQVGCFVDDNGKHCTFKQEQVNTQNKQRVLAIELAPVEDKVEGAALLPFGLSIDRGVQFQIGDAPALDILHFKTCLPGGCLIPLSFDAHNAALLRAASAMHVKAALDNGQDTTFTVSLNGFAAAFDRTAMLKR